MRPVPAPGRERAGVCGGVCFVPTRGIEMTVLDVLVQAEPGRAPLS